MVNDKNIQSAINDGLADGFRGYAALLRQIKQRVLLAQQRAIYTANEEILRMYSYGSRKPKLKKMVDRIHFSV